MSTLNVAITIKILRDIWCVTMCKQSGKLPFSVKILLVAHNVKSQVWTQNKVLFQMFKKRPITSMLPLQLGVDIKTLW